MNYRNDEQITMSLSLSVQLSLAIKPSLMTIEI